MTRQRQLMSQALGYPCPDSPPDYGIDPAQFKSGLAVIAAINVSQ
ncbi:MAG: hypothetical protein P8Y45_03505 [Exilibacterium sp.]